MIHFGHIGFFYCCVCIRCRGNVFTEQLPSNDKGNTYCHIQGDCVTYKRDLGFDDRIYCPFIQLVTTFQKLLSSTGHSRLLTTLHYMSQYYMSLLYVTIYKHIDDKVLPKTYFIAYFLKGGLCDLHPVCVYISPPSTFECFNQYLLNLVYVSWQLSPSQRRTS
jgi:hypothetical protein